MSYYPSHTQQATPNKVDLPPPPDYGPGYIYQQIWQNTHYVYWVPSMNNHHYVEIASLKPAEVPAPQTYHPAEYSSSQPAPSYDPYSATNTGLTSSGQYNNYGGLNQTSPYGQITPEYNQTTPTSYVQPAPNTYEQPNSLYGKTPADMAGYPIAASPVVEKPPENIPAINPNDITMMTCSQCGYGEVDMVLKACRHPYHLECFNNFCKTCNSEVLLPALNKKDQNSCNFCSSKENLLKCQTCQKATCFLCIHLKPLPDCCKDFFSNLEKFNTTCPGCEYELTYADFLPLKCADHALLCKKCTILGYSLKKCIMGCELKLNINEYINCEVCTKFAPAYLGHNKCKECSVCDLCQWIHNLKESIQNQVTCASCSKNQDQ